MSKKNQITIQCSHCHNQFSIKNQDFDSVTCPYCANKLNLKTDNDLILKYPNSKPFRRFLLIILSVLFSIPIFIVLHNLIPEINISSKIVDVALIILIFLLIYFLLLNFKKVIYTIFVVIIVILTFGSVLHQYGFKNLYENYTALLLMLRENPEAKEIIISKIIPFHRQSEMEKAVDYENENVRNFALKSTVKHFTEFAPNSDYRTLIQSFALFKEINSNWNYVSDPKLREYYAKASESIEHLSGDCDDHSILMVASIKAIGGQARIIHTTGHMYPEVLIGKKKDLEPINYLIKKKLFSEESKGKSIFYHIDENNRVWLNLDYTAKYPGGPFLEEEILGILNF
jgi:DNA-directed RNA polymerase subunit RPC12/RpoP